MKRLHVALVALFMALSAQAQQASTQPTAPQVAANVTVALVAGGVVSFVAIVTGNVPALCDRLQGTYTPTGPDRCPGGQWRNLLAR